jgi:hypothetical protein
MRQAAMRSDRLADWGPPPPLAMPAPLEFEPRRRDRAGWCLIRFVAAARGVQTAQLLSAKRGEADVALARQLAMYLMHVVLGRLYHDVGRFFGRDRTTVSHACAVIEDLRDDPEFDAEVSRLERRLVVRREVKHARP